MRVLIAEDDDRLARAVAAGLRRRGMTADVALDGGGALDKLAVNAYDVVVLDRDLPGVGGDEICRRLAAGRSASRILMLTAARSVRDRVEGLGLGADDYLPKPFDFTELVARIQALARRPGAPPPAGLGFGNLALEPERRVVTRAGRKLALTPKEFAVLECLLRADGRPVRAEELLQRVWDEAADPFTTTVKTTIGRLRAKLGDPPVIETVRDSPLAVITAAARRISASNLNQRLALRGPDDELKALADTLDKLFARLEASFHTQRNFVANASHELRTPLTRERAMLQVALDDPATTAETWRGVAAEVLASNAEQESLIEALLVLASGQGELGERELVDLAAVTGEILLSARPEAARQGLSVDAVTRPALLLGDKLLAERLVANLVGNAVRHNVAGGKVEISTAARDGRAVLAVANTGPAVPPEAVGRLFQPFLRLDGRRVRHDSGHGLGLSIVRAIATAHCAAITARARTGGGLSIEVTFPAIPDEPPPAAPAASTGRADAGGSARVRS